MYMIIKIDCHGHPQTLCSLSIWTSSDVMQVKGLKLFLTRKNCLKSLESSYMKPFGNVDHNGGGKKLV